MSVIAMILYTCVIQCVILMVCSQLLQNAQNRQKIFRNNRHTMLPIGKKINRLRSIEICYDTVGCFDIPRHHNPFQKSPEHPEFLETEFFLFRRNINFSNPEILKYGDGQDSLKMSKFNFKQPVKILIHGFMTKWNEDGALSGAKAYLDISDCNMVVVNWEKGARGPNYGTAAANTELIGRQLGLLLLDMTSLGTDPNLIHLIGFSLGAHVAACASQLLKDRGMLVGRITGLDPASPLFKLNHLRDKRKKLDITDARFVDVIHTDGSPVFTDGFGLLEPLGHVDFFPNGGREQPGCNDIKGSVVVSHFDKTLDRSIACSHIRSYRLFLESLIQKAQNNSECEFIAYKCPKGPKDFALGRCFPVQNLQNKLLDKNMKTSLSRLGENSSGLGPMYLVTRGNPPYCGSQLQATVQILHQTKRTSGILYLNLQHGNSTTDFQINCEILDMILNGKEVHGLAAAKYGSVIRDMPYMTANLYYLEIPDAPNKIRQPEIFINKISIVNLQGDSWQYCGMNNIQQDSILSVELKLGKC